MHITSPRCGMNVKDCGALGNGVADDSDAIQKALDGGHGLVVIPPGQYKIAKTLRMPSDTRLVAHPHARIFLADHAGINRDVFVLTNQDHQNGNHDISVEGGIWDGNNPTNRRGPDEPNSYTGVALDFANVTRLHLKGLMVCDPESYYIRLSEVSRFTIEEIRFESKHIRPNQDGVHLCGCCEDGLIRNIQARGMKCTNDDLVALNADDAMQRAQNLGGACGPISRIRVENISADDCHSFVRLLSVWSPITDITINNVRGGCRCNAVNADAARGCAVPVFDKEDPQFSDGVGLIENVDISNMDVHRTQGCNPLLLLETRMKNFRIRQFKRNDLMDVAPEAPTLLLREVVTETVAIEGLTEQDAAALKGRLPAADLEVVQQASPYAQPSYAVSACVGKWQSLVSKTGSFSNLAVGECFMKALPNG